MINVYIHIAKYDFLCFLRNNLVYFTYILQSYNIIL